MFQLSIFPFWCLVIENIILVCVNQGQASEWALLRRHSSEDFFGVQICGAYPDTVSKTVELIEQECSVDFIDINMGCPIDIVVNKGAGSALLTKPMRMKSVIQAASGTVDTPITVKVWYILTLICMSGLDIMTLKEVVT